MASYMSQRCLHFVVSVSYMGPGSFGRARSRRASFPCRLHQKYLSPRFFTTFRPGLTFFMRSRSASVSADDYHPVHVNRIIR